MELHSDPVRKLSANLYDIYKFADSLRAGSGWRSILILLASCQQTYMTYTSLLTACEQDRDGVTS